jgi:hypothetical protein
MDVSSAEKKPRSPNRNSSGDAPPPRLQYETALPNPRMFASPDTSRALLQEDKIDAYIANALYAMSLQERESTYQEMHGVMEEIEETSELLSQKFFDFETRLATKIQSLPSNSALRIAAEQFSDYIQDPIFRLMFLRADRFDVEKAVSRMAEFLEIKKYLFGMEKLGKTITLDDLDRNDRASLESGFLQVLPVRDTASRLVFVLMHRHKKFHVVENMTRALYYTIMSCLEDEETQCKGVTLIIYGVGGIEPCSADFQFVSHGAWSVSALPHRVVSLHYCFSDPIFRQFINFCLPLFPQTARARSKVHCGSGLECVYALMTYGIPTDVLPVNMVDGAGLKRKNHAQWLKMRKQQEAHPGVQPHIVIPTNRDILFGRGKKYREHLGNLKMVSTLESYIELYESVGVREKSVVIANVTKELMDKGARFLKLEGDVWQPVDEKVAREKVSHCFRTRIRINGSNAPRAYSSNGTSISCDSNSVDSKRAWAAVD